MNKTTIKISVLAFLGFMTYGYAQQQQQDPYKGKVGVNTVTPSATMDVQPNNDNARVEAKTNEGIIAPKLSKTRIANIETPVEGTLVYATDDATSLISAYTGNDPKVAKITEKGYYFYNGTEWVKVGSEVTDQLWAQRDNNGVTETYLKPANANSDFVGYKSDRKFKINLGNVTESLFSNDRSPIEYFISSDLFPSTTSDYFAFSRNNLLLKQTQISRNFRAPYYGIANIIKTENIVTPFQEVTGNLTISEHSSSAKANEVVGSFTLSKSTALSQAGRISGIVVTAENQGTAENMSAIRSYIANKGNITNIRGIYNFVKSNSETNPHNIALYRGVENRLELAEQGTTRTMDGVANVITIGNSTNVTAEGRGVFTYISAGNNSNVVNLLGTQNQFSIRQGANIENLTAYLSLPQINNGAEVGTLINFHADLKGLNSSATLTNVYGLKVESINTGTNRYAIHTEAGNIRFGDLQHSVSTNVASTGDRPVFVTADGVLKVGNASTALARAVWVPDTASNSVQLAITSANGDRTTHPISITDEGMVRATSFQGVNGATIFPDYVFQKYYTGTSSIKADYNFKSLSQVEDFVKENGHLPGYKSAETIKAQGYVDLMETQLTNVEKIEELYLHLMEKEKEVKELRNKNQELENRLERLEKLLK